MQWLNKPKVNLFVNIVFEQPLGCYGLFNFQIGTYMKQKCYDKKIT